MKKEEFVKYEEFETEEGKAVRIVSIDSQAITNGDLITENSVPSLVIDEYEKYKKFIWCEQWKELSEKEMELVWLVYGKDNLRDKIKNKIDVLKTPGKLLTYAEKLIFKRGWNKTCTRCGGTGEYSYNQRYGTKCFKCEGKKVQLVLPTKTEFKKLTEKYPNGIKEHENEIVGKGKLFN